MPKKKNTYIKTIVVPITIVHEDETIRKQQFNYINEVLHEATELANYSIECMIAHKCNLLLPEYQKKAITTFLYGRATKRRILVDSGSVGTLTHKYIPAEVNKAYKERAGIPHHTKPILCLRPNEISIDEIVDRKNLQFHFKLPNFKKTVSRGKGTKKAEFDQKVALENYDAEFDKGDNFAGKKIYALNKEYITLIKTQFSGKLYTVVNKIIIENEKTENKENIFGSVIKVTVDVSIKNKLLEWSNEYNVKRPIAEEADIEWLKNKEKANLAKSIKTLKIINTHGDIKFTSKFKHKDKSQPEEVKKILCGEYSLCGSSMTRKNNIYFLNLSVSCPQKSSMFDEKNICGIDLGVNIPIYAATNYSKDRIRLGNKDDIYAAKNKLKAQRRNNQRRGTPTKGHEKERNQQKTLCQTLAVELLAFVMKNNCGTIHLEDLSGIKKDKLNERGKNLTEEEIEKIQNKFKWFNKLIWTPYLLRKAIEYQAEQHDIKVVLINPAYTSRRCSHCGYIDKTSNNECRPTQAKFKCVNCNETENADYNAARNIALAKGSVIKNGYS